MVGDYEEEVPSCEGSANPVIGRKSNSSADASEVLPRASFFLPDQHE